jgi:hypothetical protein
LLKVTHNQSLEVLEEMREINMGAPEALRDVLAYARENYPVNGYVPEVYDYRGGWRGSYWDKTSYNDGLPMNDMCQALTQAGGVDIILLSATCL